VRNAEQPALDIGDRSRRREGLDRLDEGILHDVLAVDDRACHAGAIAVQPGPQVAQQPVELRARVAVRRRVGLVRWG
jgi:hypothetical protein